MTADETMTDMTRTTRRHRNFPAGPARVPQERRQRRHLRDLCDEVLASFRVARSRELITEDELAESRAMLATMTPILSR